MWVLGWFCAGSGLALGTCVCFWLFALLGAFPFGVVLVGSSERVIMNEKDPATTPSHTGRGASCERYRARGSTLPSCSLGVC